MTYTLSIDSFKSTFNMKDNPPKITHYSGKRIKLFPYIANNNIDSITSLSSIIGRYLSRIQEQNPVSITAQELADRLAEETDISHEDQDLFRQVVRNIFFDDDGNLLPVNLKALSHIPCNESNEIKVADYLVDVLGDMNTLKNIVSSTMDGLSSQSNVLERAAMDALESVSAEAQEKTPYFRITNALQSKFEQDFEYILSSRSRTREYLVQLLEFYYFSYTAQAIMQLNRFLDGLRTECVPLYFCLEWEKTSQSRPCYTDGWGSLEAASQRIFAHAIVLEILNQTPESCEPIDYVQLNIFVQSNPAEDERISREIRTLRELYTSAIRDCTLDNLSYPTSYSSKTAAEVKYLFDLVDYQFKNTSRSRPYDSYAKQFLDFCKNFLKRRGRSGSMLNLSEETIIFLTKIAIKDQNKMRLNDVFAEFESRGVFLDVISKEQIMHYYEKLNLIEKKSDSGDAQYVKRIL